MATSNERAFFEFLRCRRDDLHRIARRSANRLTIEEIESEAWIAALEIRHRRGLALDFLDTLDQEMLLGRLYIRLVKYPGVSVRYAARLDHGWSGDEERPGPTLASLLMAPHDNDPQVRQLLLEESEDFLEVVSRSYSQAAAYVLLLIRVEWQLRDLADLLWIGVETLRKRLRHCAELAGMQPSLFDGVDSIDRSFEPTRRKTALRFA